MNDFHVIIPARYASTRLPGKPLAKIGDQSMIERVYHKAKESGAATVCVATDDQRIFDAVNAFGGQAVMTRTDHQSGTDRVYEAAQALNLSKEAIVVNLQGDEPFVPAQIIRQVAQLLDKPEKIMSTLCTQITCLEDVNNPNVVKVVFNQIGKAIYFSRAAIPFQREGSPNLQNYFRHIGIYGFRMSLLEKFSSLSESSLEDAEKLEQLRVLDNGYAIEIAVAEETPPGGIDTPEDLVAANRMIEQLREA
ncbi:3-deoxy-manno-octulosonate cytidylyltransferase [Pleionea litopenaei]|uniref:3-deoxy-manno-octulosonate cytidylyltransferase n=1 Tax=Pleionea litopenaei TaxID=3070815 RepID=A0AA51RUP5_9GAMM|nr:3-deoxy-manno-octulosonate cytidylyltransferase [Pleionea sp. HL-JVS1]WMS88041.1 3-deoxy-manno-octulosonate cytidylyltransferase [Pleionea sp. HL-JVS1]